MRSSNRAEQSWRMSDGSIVTVLRSYSHKGLTRHTCLRLSDEEFGGQRAGQTFTLLEHYFASLFGPERVT